MERISKTKEDFAWTQWDADTIRRVAREILDNKKKLYAEIKAIPAVDRTFENTVYGIEEAGDSMVAVNYFDILMNASPIESIRKAAEEVIKMIRLEMVDMEYNRDVYRAFHEFADKRLPLEGEDAKLFEDMDLTYKRMGFHLSPDQQEVLKKNLKRMNELGTDFELNIKNYDDHILVSKEELDGLPDNYIEGLSKNEEGNYKISLKYPELIPFMENATHADRRKDLLDISFKKGSIQNVEIAKELLFLRKQNAVMLGYANHADFVTERRMAKNKKTVDSFLSLLAEKLQPLTDKDFDDLRACKRAITSNPEADLEYYDTAFYATQLEKQRFNIDAEKIREYFPAEHVIKETLDIYSSLFSLSFEPITDILLWHSDAKLFKVRQNDEEVGYIFLDLFPRDNKFGHAACFPVVYGHASAFHGDAYITPLVGLMANFNKPGLNRPGLFSHDEVVTLFHELGHVFHSLLNGTAYSSLSAVAWDFVEVPSQIMEYWPWDKELMRKISNHYKTGLPLPEEMMDNMIKGKYYLVGWGWMRQIIYSLFDITIHGEAWPGDLASFANELIEKRQHIKFPPNLFPSWFGHFVGYDAGYYSYLWSRVICADMFGRFKKEGLLNPVMGKEFRDKVLAVGGSRDEVDTVRDFLGRDFTQDAYLEEIGVKK